jgi:cytochrome c oxidase cbb3-type subunit 2
VALTEAGTNQPALLQALALVREGLPETDARQFVVGLPKVVRRDEVKDEAEAAVKRLSVGGAKAQVWVVPTGPDIGRGWGKRHSVAEDYLFDYPVMLGSRRIGPDLANVGVRQPDRNWHLLHLYTPSIEVPGSTMPTYRFLFEKRRIERAPSPDALVLPPELAPPPGYEIVPTPEARTLVAYLLSLREDAPLFDAPLTVPAAASSTSTNPATVLSGTTTNTASRNAPPK